MPSLWQYLTGRRKPRRDAAGSGGGTSPKNAINCKVLLLDGTEYEVSLNKHAKGSDLMEKVNYHLDLFETDYFGLTFSDHITQHWLDPTKRIAKQLLMKPPYTLRHRVKFYCAEPNNIKEDITRYQMFLNLKSDILSGKLECDHEIAVELASYALQSELGDFSESDLTLEEMKEYKFFPDQDEVANEDIFEQYQTLANLTPAQAELRYLNKARYLSDYGVDMHEVTGRDGDVYKLGLTPSGILVFENNHRIGLFFWPNINGLQMNGKKMIVTVAEEDTSGEKKDHTFVFRLTNQKACKHLWKCAIEFHTFYRLKKPVIATGTKTGFIRRESRFRPSFRTEFQMRNEVRSSRRAIEFERQGSARSTKRGNFERSEAVKAKERSKARAESEAIAAHMRNKQTSSTNSNSAVAVRPPSSTSNGGAVPPSQLKRPSTVTPATSPTNTAVSNTLKELDTLIQDPTAAPHVSDGYGKPNAANISLLEASERAQARLKCLDETTPHSKSNAVGSASYSTNIQQQRVTPPQLTIHNNTTATAVYQSSNRHSSGRVSGASFHSAQTSLSPTSPAPDGNAQLSASPVTVSPTIESNDKKPLISPTRNESPSGEANNVSKTDGVDGQASKIARSKIPTKPQKTAPPVADKPQQRVSLADYATENNMPPMNNGGDNRATAPPAAATSSITKIPKMVSDTKVATARTSESKIPLLSSMGGDNNSAATPTAVATNGTSNNNTAKDETQSKLKSPSHIPPPAKMKSSSTSGSSIPRRSGIPKKSGAAIIKANVETNL